MYWRGGTAFPVLWVLVALCGCEPDATAETSRQTTGASPASSATDPSDQDAEPVEPAQGGLVLGDYRLLPDGVIDGDTIRVESLDDSVRLLSIDTEERARNEADRIAMEADFEAYLKAKREGAARPKKPGTPMGDQAAEFAAAFFDGVETVRLERDDPKALRGRYGRHLAYAFVQKDGKWTSYNVEAVRAGMSPYFTKYGYSKRFHNQFARAEAEARREQRGIWNPDSKGYGDYTERRDWWDARADFIQASEHEAAGRDDFIVLTNWDAQAQLRDSLGEEVTVLGTVDKVQHFKRLVRVFLSGEQGHRFPIIFFDKRVFPQSGLGRYKGEPVTVRGSIERYKRGNHMTLQIVVDDPEQISLPTLPWPDETEKAAE